MTDFSPLTADQQAELDLLHALEDREKFLLGIIQGLVPARNETCAYEGCTEPATCLACGRRGWRGEIGRHPEPARYCDGHAAVVAEEGHPEYTVGCPACGCGFGVN